MARRLVIVALGGGAVAHHLGGAALPIGSARDGDRPLGPRPQIGEVAGGELAVAEEAQGDPAGMELGLHRRLVGLRRIAGGDGIGGFGSPRVEELAGDEAALDPPFVGPDQARRVARRRARTAAASRNFSARRSAFDLREEIRRGRLALEAGTAASRAAALRAFFSKAMRALATATTSAPARPAARSPSLKSPS